MEGTLILSEKHTDENGVEHTNELYRKLNGTLQYFHNGEELWMCPHARWWGWMLCCQIKFDIKDEVPLSQWIREVSDKGTEALQNPRVIHSRCDCKYCPDSWDECTLASNLIKENK